MALRAVSARRTREALSARVLSLSNAWRAPVFLIALLICSISAHAQFQQPFVFAVNPNGPTPGILVFTRNDLTGILTPVAGSPFPSRETANFITVDFKGRFLFTANHGNSKISMFTIDPNTGAVQEVPNSPFASSFTNTPVFLSSESSGQFLYAINFYGLNSNADASSFESFQIDAANRDLKPSSNGATDLPGLIQPCGAGTHPSGKTFYAYANNPTPSNPNAASFVVFNGSTGTFTYQTSAPGVDAICLAVNPQGTLIATSAGQGRYVSTYTLNPDGTLGLYNGIFSTSGAPSDMVFDTFGRFLYVLYFEGPPAGYRVHVLSTTANPPSLQETPDSPLASSFPTVNLWTVDPTAPLIYADQVYQVDPQTGLLSTLLPSSPITPPAIFTQPPGSQPILGPLALLSSTSLAFGNLSVGQTSSAQTLTITSNGGQALSLNTISITGPNSSDFSVTGDTCHVPTVLQVGSSCSVLISFTPSATGARSATLTITDNASPPAESVQLSGTGLTPAPAVSLIPGTLDFGTVTQGTSTPLNISVKNSGTAALHITSVAIGGANASDYSSASSGCSTALAVNSSCTVTVTFTPLAPGVRSTTLTLADDAPGSPQTVQITGNATPAFLAGAAQGGSTTASVAPGQTAQYQLQLTPGPGYSGTVSLTCSGAPLGAVCHVPATVPLANGAAAPFTVTVSTSGGALLPPAIPKRFIPPGQLLILLLAALALVLLGTLINGEKFAVGIRAKRLAWSSALAAVFICTVIYAAGCGATGAPVATVPPPIITPGGTTTLTLSPTAMSSTGQPLQLQPIQLTLTVK